MCLRDYVKMKCDAPVTRYKICEIVIDEIDQELFHLRSEFFGIKYRLGEPCLATTAAKYYYNTEELGWIYTIENKDDAEVYLHVAAKFESDCTFAIIEVQAEVSGVQGKQNSYHAELFPPGKYDMLVETFQKITPRKILKVVGPKSHVVPVTT